MLNASDVHWRVGWRSRFAVIAVFGVLTLVVGAAGAVYCVPSLREAVIDTVPQDVTVIEMSPNGETLALISRRRSERESGSTVFLVDAQQLEKPKRFAGFFERVIRMAWSADGELLAMASWNGFVQVWEVKPRRQLWLKRVSKEEIWEVAFAGSNLVAISGSACEPGCGGQMSILNSRTGEPLSVDVRFKDTPTGLAVSPEGDRAYLGASYGYSIMEHELPSGTLLHEIPWGGTRCIALSEDGQYLAMTGHKKISVFNREIHEALCHYEQISNEYDDFGRVQFIPERNELLIKCRSIELGKSKLTRWSFEQGKLSQEQDYGDIGIAFAISKDGNQIFHSVKHGVATIDL